VRSSKFANLRQVLTLAIAMIYREYQEREEQPPNRVSHFFTLSPISTSPRMALERFAFFALQVIRLPPTLSGLRDTSYKPQAYLPKAQQALAGLSGAIKRLGGRHLALMPGAARHVQSREA
jgi:hypothetical protein